MKKFIAIISLFSLLLASCEKNNEVTPLKTLGKATVTFDAVFGTQDFSINKDFMSGSKTYNFTKFRYWVTNLILVDTKGEEYNVPNSYFLIEETAAVPVQDGAFTYPATKRETIQLNDIPIGDYQAIKFSIGIESKYNDNLSLQIGELSQLNGMTNVSWMWMTSYIFSSIGGKVTDGNATKNILVETGLNTNYKSVLLNLPTPLLVGSNKNAAIILTTDVSKAIDGIDLIANPVVGASKANLMAQVATNYTSKVFAVKSNQ